MCVYIAIIATTLKVMLWRVNSASALNYYGYELECWLAGQLKKSSIGEAYSKEGKPVCECTG